MSRNLRNLSDGRQNLDKHGIMGPIPVVSGILILMFVFLNGCSAAPAATAPPGGSQTASTAKESGQQPAAGPRSLSMLGLGGQQETMLRNVLAGFEKQNGVTINYEGLSDPQVQAKAIANKGNGQLDLVIASDQGVLRLKEEGAAAKFDPARVSNLAKVPQALRNTDGIAVPQGIGLIGISYNKKVFDEKGFPAPVSIFDLWKPEFKGHVAIRTLDVNLTYTWFPVIAKALTGDEKNIDPVFKKFQELAPNLLTFMKTSSQSDDLFKAGDLWIAIHTQPRTAALKAQGFPIEFVIPKEGATAYFNWIIALAGSKNPQLRDDLLNHFLTPPSQKIMAEEFSYAPLIPGVELDPAKAKSIPTQADVAKVVASDFAYLDKNLPAWIERWNKEVER